MAFSNNLTAQAPVATGLTGTQVVRWVAADRAYIKAIDSTPTPIYTRVVNASTGVTTTPAGYTDLGIVNGKVAINYNKDIAEIRTGLDQVLRDSYVRQRTGTFEFTLGQFDDVAFKEVSGLSASQITSSSVYTFRVGSEDVIKRALLLVSYDKLTGKEWHFYHPQAQLSFQIQDDSEATVLRVVANLPMFTWENGEVIFCPSIIA